ncbi:CPBP family intramembrane metalloprotease [Paenibacillus sp. 598K]|uniref:CPBP family intramembrane glutamic endopeptidase n=1 Tax=Paenibacillus sp. 598K TaxID=1117987 RepID=UPI000FFA6C90|nr:CPBP family intramembrane glutamic endopeptidase [Paenibacillus sp. 598K]GBF75254.1 CPBP family intramembrane metalloprotease [Paenibacillus sp. 598K]
MSELNARQHHKLLLQILLGLMPFLVLGVALIAIFRWGEIIPYIGSLFVAHELSFLHASLLGLIVGTIVVLVSVGLIVKTNTQLPQSEGTEMILQLMRTPSGIAASALGGGIVEEFFFRGVLIGLFIGYNPVVDGIVIGISTLLFWIIHIPQYKGVYLAYGLVCINGLIFALLFYLTGSLIPSMIAHAIYNLGIGIYFMRNTATVQHPL